MRNNMPEPINPNPAPANPGANPNPTPTPGATDPKQQPGNGGGDSFDPSKIGDEDFAKVLEDPRLWNQPRIKELREAQKLLKTQQTEAEKAEQERLKKQGEFQTLAEQNEKKALDWQNKYTTALTDNAIMAEASKKGVTDLDAAKKLLDRSKLTVDENGNVQGAAEAVEQLVKDKPYLVGGAAQPTVGSPTNPANPGGNGQFKLSQLQDPAFYQANQAAIQKAMATPGAIIDDLH